MKKLCALLFILTALSSCNDEPVKEEVTVLADTHPQSDIEKLSWILGNWENLSSEGNSYERWKKISDKQYAGIGFVLSNADTVFFERLQIEERSDGLYYIPTVRDQNNAGPVSFKLSSSAGNTFLFENPTHDFPQKILYKQISADSLYSEISGVQNGKQRVEKFPMRRGK